MSDMEPYASSAATLFRNMVTPASIMAGALISVGLNNAPDFKTDKHETATSSFLRNAYPLVTVMTFISQFIAILWAIISINQLTELDIKDAESVWHLLQRDFALPWAAVNAHFVLGMFGFIFVIGTKSYFNCDKGPMGKSVAGVSCAGLLFLVSIVNRGVSSGGGEEGLRFGASVLSLFKTYFTLLLSRMLTNFGPLEFAALAVGAYSTGNALICAAKDMKSKKSRGVSV